MNDPKKIIEELETGFGLPKDSEKLIINLFQYQLDYIENLENRISDLEWDAKPDSEKYIQ